MNFRWRSKDLPISEELEAILSALYPTLDIRPIHFKKGMPWYVYRSFAAGITLPHSFKRNTVVIYCRHPFNDLRDWSLIVHEVFHVKQYQELRQSTNFGFSNRFLAHYLANYFALFFRYLRHYKWAEASNKAYFDHPMEIPAYRFEERFNLNLAHSKSRTGSIDFSVLLSRCRAMNCKDTMYQYTHPIIWLQLSWILVIVLGILKPILDLIAFLFAGPLILTMQLISSRKKQK